MSHLSQLEIQKRASILAQNGRLPNAQTVIGVAGYTPATLDDGEMRIATWVGHRNGRKAALAEQKRATHTQYTAREAARKEVTSLSNMIRTLFAKETEVLTEVGLSAQHVTVMDEEGNSKVLAKRPSKSIAEEIGRWQLLVANTKTLSAPQLTELASVGWTAARLTALNALITTYQQADIVQQAAIAKAQAEAVSATEAFAALEKWYTRAVRVCKQAIQDHDPANAQQLLELLGFDLS